MCSGLGDLHEEASLEAVLYQKLMKGYSRRTRPVKDHSHHINITVQMILTQVVDLVSTNTCTISVNWFDKATDVPLGCAMSQFIRVFLIIYNTRLVFLPTTSFLLFPLLNLS